MKLPEGCAPRVPVEPDEIEPEDQRLYFALKSVSHLYLDRALPEGGHVEGTFSGRIKGLTKAEQQTTFLVEVLDAEITYPPREGAP